LRFLREPSSLLSLAADGDCLCSMISMRLNVVPGVIETDG
jgi:hypothetical protein